jgi:hypothetical protein
MEVDMAEVVRAKVFVDRTAETLAVTMSVTANEPGGRRKLAGQNTWDTVAEMVGDLEGQLDTWFPDNATTP